MKCRYCASTKGQHKLTFQQLYPQFNSAPSKLSWSYCSSCGTYYVDPLPTIEQISSYWKTTAYNNPALEAKYNEMKRLIYNKIFDIASQGKSMGSVFDYGCNFGQFLDVARSKGWSTGGFDPNPDAVSVCIEKGHDVFQSFDFNSKHKGAYDAVTVIDVLYYVWDPHQALREIFSMLKPGGRVVIRMSNKRFYVNGIMRFLPNGDLKNKLASKVLQAQLDTFKMH